TRLRSGRPGTEAVPGAQPSADGVEVRVGTRRPQRKAGSAGGRGARLPASGKESYGRFVRGAQTRAVRAHAAHEALSRRVAEARRIGETRPGRIAERAHTTPSALSQTFKSLEEKGLIERHRAGGDCRGVAVVLTSEGERLAAEAKRLHSKHMDEVMAYVGEE